MTLKIVGCKTEYAINPLGLSTLAPRLFWRIETQEQAVRQTAYQILVASSLQKLNHDDADMWDSGKIVDNRSIQIVYEGKPLQEEGIYYWKVRVWDGNDQQSAWSEPAFWTMGLLSRIAWKGKWIGRKPVLKVNPSEISAVDENKPELEKRLLPPPIYAKPSLFAALLSVQRPMQLRLVSTS